MEDIEVEIKSFDIGIAVRNQLHDLKKREPKYSEIEYKKFMLSELKLIKKLYLRPGIKSLEGLQYLTNLEDLTIESVHAKQISTYIGDSAQYKYLSSQNQIKNFSYIENLSNLKFLTIKNDVNINSLDISKLKELTHLELSNNPNLKYISGLSEAFNLSTLILDRNEIKNSFNIKDLINNHCLSDIKLDIQMFPVLNRYNSDLADFLINKQKEGIKAKWVENYSNLSCNEIYTYQIVEMQRRAEKIINSIIDKNFSDIEKVCAIYYYVINNLSYDHEGLKNRKNEFNKEKKVSGETEAMTNAKINSSYNAFMLNKCVCEGFTNMMKYLLSLCEIESRTVSCCPKKDNENELVGLNSSHSIIKIKIKDDWYYCDPTWDNLKTQIKYFFKTKNEISQTHNLSMAENGINSPLKKTYTNEELTYCMNNILNMTNDSKHR